MLGALLPKVCALPGKAYAYRCQSLPVFMEGLRVLSSESCALLGVDSVGFLGVLVGCGGEAGRLRGQAVQTVANESGAPTSWRPTQCYLNQISSYQIETVSTIQINLMKIY